MKRNMELRHISFFQNKNAFSGSCEGMRFRLSPEGETLKASVWHSDLCFDLCQVEAEKEFPLDEAGLEAAAQWLEEQI